METKFSGLIYQDFLNYLDHLAPFCSLLNIPLVVTEKTIKKTAEK